MFTGLFNVRDFGAAVDGQADDTAAVTAAACAAAALPNGGTVVFPSGTTRIVSNLTFGPTTTLQFISGARISVPTGVTVTILGPLIADAWQIFVISGTGSVKFGNVTNASPVRMIYPQWWGAKNDGTDATATTTAINAALASVTVFTITGAGDTIGGQRVFLSSGVYSVNSSLAIGTQNSQVISPWLEGESMLGTRLVWVGGNGDDIIDVGATVNLLNAARIENLTLTNQATSGSGVTAVRSTGINGIKLNQPLSAGVNNLTIDHVCFTFLDNGIVANAAGVNQLTVTRCIFSAIYNQTSPVVNPYTDALVTGHGNAIYLPVGCVPQGVYIKDNYFNSVQGYGLNALGTSGVVNLVYSGNFQEAALFQRTKAVGLSAFTNISIHGNEIGGSQTGNSTEGPMLDLGTTALGSSDVSGGVVSSNYITQQMNVTGNPVIQVTYGDGLVIEGNTFFALNSGASTTNPGIKIHQTATNVTIGTNNWVNGGTFNTRLIINGGPSAPPGFVCTDPGVGMSGLLFDPEQQFEVMEDFDGASAAGLLTAGNSIDALRQRVTAAATGTYAFLDGSATGTTNGVLRITGSGAAVGGIIIGASTFPMRRSSLPGVLKIRWAQTGTGAGTRFIGLSSGAALTADINNSLYFRHAAAGNIIAVLRGAGVDSATLDTGVAAADGVYHTGRIVVVNPNQADVYIDSVFKGRFGSGGIPQSNMSLSAGTAATGAADGLDVDYLYAAQQRK